MCCQLTMTGAAGVSLVDVLQIISTMQPDRLQDTT
jgi:hypothetical protein